MVDTLDGGRMGNKRSQKRDRRRRLKREWQNNVEAVFRRNGVSVAGVSGVAPPEPARERYSIKTSLADAFDALADELVDTPDTKS
jgi:hypothetical protein